ncbi:MAG TPA: helix-turn-helix transcriptional regulator [Cellvibrio sp.]|nr:helix-turn-helix transcriptional regulator [Cellvibrio sp.]
MSQPITDHQEQETMNISSSRIRQLRHECGWSQEQLAHASGLSLRTIQRVETEERASRETRVCLAATFNLPLAELLEPVDAAVMADTGKAAPQALSVRRYKIALAAAVIAVVPSLLGFAGVIVINQLVSVGFMAAIALFLYGGFGLYFTGAPRHAPGVKSYTQMAFSATAIFCGFAALAQDNPAAIGLAGQVAVLIVGAYFLFDYLRSRRQTSK